MQHDRVVKFTFGSDKRDRADPATARRGVGSSNKSGSPERESAGPHLWAFEAHEGSRIAEEAGIPSQRLPNGRLVRYYFRSDVHRAVYQHDGTPASFPVDPFVDLRRLQAGPSDTNIGMLLEDCPLLPMHRMDERRLPPIGSLLDPNSPRWRSRPWARGLVLPSPFEGKL